MADRLRSVVLPVEIKNREFDAMVLLGCVLAERGQRSIVGSRRALKQRIHRLPRSVYLGKTVTVEVLKYYRYLIQLGHTVTALDEEGLVIYSPEIYVRRRVGRQTLDLASALFAWGDSNADIWRGCLNGDGDKIFTTGNPRLDVLRPELRALYAPEAARLRERYGDYVLFNSNFQWVNPLIGGRVRLPHPDDVEAGRMVAPRNYDPELARYRIATFDAYLEMIRHMAQRFGGLSFVLRPHPGENAAAWRETVGDLPNCHVIYESASIPWILGARALLHHSCTTAVEAFLLDRPAISYRPLRRAGFDPEVPIRLSREAASLDELEAAIEDVLQDGARPQADPDRRAFLQGHAAHLEGALASEDLAARLAELPLVPPPLGARLEGLAHTARKQVNRMFEGDDHPDRTRWRRHIFPGAELAEVEQRIATFGRLLGRFGRIRAAQLAPDVFVIEAA